QCLEHGIGDVGAGAVLCLLGGCTQVRGDNNLGQLEQRGVGAGLGVVDIETGTTDVAGLDRIRQCLLIDEATAGRVDDDLALLGLGQELGVEHAGGLLGLGQVDGNEVGATHQFFQLHELYAELCGTCRVGVGIVGDDGGLESSEALSEQLSDVAEADDADGLAEDLHTVEGGALPLAVTQGGVSGRDLASGGQQQGDGVLTCGVDVGGRGVGDHDASLSSGGDVDVVQTNASTADDLQVGRCCDDFCIHLGGGTHEEGVCLLDC